LVSLSIIIPSYNYDRFLPTAIESCLSQATEQTQVIVVDDCSTDNSRNVIAQYSGRVTAVLQPGNSGHGEAFNAGFKRATGELVMFLDADDFLLPGGISKILSSYEPDVAIYHFRMLLADVDGNLGSLFPPPQKPLASGDISEALRFRGRYNGTVTSGLVFNRRILDRVLPMDKEMFRQGGDGYLSSCVPLYGKSKSSNDVLSAYRIHGGNHSTFMSNFVKKLEWKIQHDEHRHNTIRDHSRILGLPVGEDLANKDEIYLEEKLSQVIFRQAYPGQSRERSGLARLGLAAADPVAGVKAQGMQKIWWFVLGWAPLGIARSLLLWKTDVNRRPKIVKVAARFIRRAFGVTLK
jgi:glycosyltransferase involved in cell wall biosynthesis